GHLGTLDPFASGLLPILIGGVTRLSDEMMDGKKQYLFQIKLGIETDTLDTAGQVVKTQPVPGNYIEKIKQQLNLFMGEIEQVPPVYSALKMQGRPLYEYMRAEGKLPQSIETKKRKVLIEKIDVLENIELNAEENNLVTLRVLCGKGTYVRSLARDLSASIGTVGHCFSLRREYVEPWCVDNAVLFSQDIKPSMEDIQKNIILPEQILPYVPKITVPEGQKKLFCAGNVVTLTMQDVSVAEWMSATTSQVCFAETVDGIVMYYANLQRVDEHTIKIKPNKKIS
ncbi:MAG: tRNA pseudouridine(55) synthase TruB, partial [Bdellovibrionota bacterium]